MPNQTEHRHPAETCDAGLLIGHKDFWYILAQSHELKTQTVLARQILGEAVVLFRNEKGRAVALQDRCLHRMAPLSKGKMTHGKLQCSYHGWTYDGRGQVTKVPSLCDEKNLPSCSAATYPLIEAEGYLYICPSGRLHDDIRPFSIPHYDQSGWEHVRLTNRIKNNVTNCVENFVDIPHTAYVHDKIFRSEKRQTIKAQVTRKNGGVFVEYQGEQSNAGIYRWFLNPKNQNILHKDNFYMPNITSVEYGFGKKRFFITSQSVPVAEDETLVFTDLTYNYGIWNKLARPLIRRYGQCIIDQDIDVLAGQMESIKRYGQEFTNMDADIIHVFIESIRRCLDFNQDPRKLPVVERNIEFKV